VTSSRRETVGFFLYGTPDGSKAHERERRRAGSVPPDDPLLILPMLHLLLCFVVDFTISDNEGGWKWFLVGLVDYPASSILKQVGFLDPFLTFGIFGTLWWYFVGVVFRSTFRIFESMANR
jgi:hypothetical protein